MTLKSVSSLEPTTKGELLAMCKLVQMVTHQDEHKHITPETWKEYVVVSLGIEREAADALINRSRRLANRILAHEAK